MLLVFLFTKCYSQDLNSNHVRIVFYNVENLFDIYNDSLKEDDDFLPDGLMRWNFTRYNRKINSLYKTIIAAGEWAPPSVVALCEVENRKVLEDLVFGTYLSKFKYRIVHKDSPDQRGIDVCLIYRDDCVKIIDYKYFIPEWPGQYEFTSRSVLYTKFIVLQDTIHLFVNHWPSRRGGVLAGEDIRIKIAEMVREKSDSINTYSNMGAKIIIMGDYNSTPDDKEIRTMLTASNKKVLLVNLSERLAENGVGTYRYMGTWEMIDQVLVSEKLLKSDTGLNTDISMLNIFKPDFLLKKDTRYPGYSPYSTYKGYRYQGGFSDHLPVYIDLRLK
jgi:predicted extracellular nuclease